MLVIAVVGFDVSNKVGPVGSGWWGSVNETEGFAIREYDAGTPVLGEAAIAHNWHAWPFASEEHRKLCVTDPTKYAPIYGGFCATVISAGVTTDTNPKIWHVHDGRLYLFIDDSLKTDWLSELESGSIELGDQNWAGRDS